MRRLNEIIKRTRIDVPGRAEAMATLPKDDFKYLIARVEKLEAALRDMNEQAVLHGIHAAFHAPWLEVVTREALAEEEDLK